MKIEFFPTDFQKLNTKFMKIRSLGARVFSYRQTWCADSHFLEFYECIWKGWHIL